MQVQTIRQGYLSKRSSNLRGDWKRRFFVLDSRGMLYYYRKQWSKPSVSFLSKKNVNHASSIGEMERESFDSWQNAVGFPSRTRIHVILVMSQEYK